jgi:alkaline phosphatase
MKRNVWVFLLGCLMTPLTASAGQVVLFLGDGMGVTTVTAGRILAGQKLGRQGEEHQLSFESFDNVALIKTYNTDMQVPDSAGTMSAIVTGKKTRFGVLSVNRDVERGNCAQSLTGMLPTLLELAEKAGFATGLVTTTRITHATPAANYAHVPERDWEDDSMLPPEAVTAGCKDIARQLVEFGVGDGVDVILGGGRTNFLPAGVADPEYPEVQGRRKDGRNLITEWLALGNNSKGVQRQFVWKAETFAALETKGQVLGLFEPSHMQFDADRSKDRAGEPSLAEMTSFAIKMLQGRSRNFFLVVEGGRIDHGHHAGNAYRALHDVLALDAAVAVANTALNPKKSLLLVTADHSHTLTFSGYPPRGNPILGKVPVIPGGGEGGAPTYEYPTLGYANGPGAVPDYTTVDTQSPNFRQPATLPMLAETHGGDDVAAYARGVASELVHGVMEQNELHRALYKALFGKTER